MRRVNETQGTPGDDVDVAEPIPPYRSRIAEEYGVEPLSQEALEAHERKIRRWLILAGVALVVVLIALVLFYVLVGKNFLTLKVSLPQDDPLDKVTVVDRVRPSVSDPTAIAQRLQNVTGADWRTSVYNADETPLSAIPGTITSKVRLPGSAEFAEDFEGMITNLGDTRSVESNGALLAVWFFSDRTIQNWIGAEDVTAFADDGLEADRQTYWVGKWVVFYSPGEIDHTEDLHTWIKEFKACPTHANECVLDSETAAFSEWAEE